MTSPCEVHIFCDDKVKAQNIAGKILESAKLLEKKYNFYDPNSFLSSINQRKTDQLDSQTKDLLSRAKLFYKKTDGIFDITMGTLVDSRKQKSIDEVETEVNRLLPFVGVEHFKIKKNKISFDNLHTLIDLGGFVKEFAVDLAVGILKKNKIQSALINFGGDIFALGTKPDGEPFSVGIKNPLNPSEFITHVTLQDQALTTSASYERSTKIEDKTYSHIINKNLLQTEIISATVVSAYVVESGVYSTALMIDPDLKLNFKKILITKDLVII